MAEHPDAYPTSRRARTIKLGARDLRVKGMASGGLHDLYSLSMTSGWLAFYASIAGLFMALNLIFAAIYNALPGGIANQSPAGFWGAFFFSVETLATVGYGDMHPATLTAHCVATLEILIGMTSIALITGLTFSRFSKPRARIIASRHPVICQYNGQATLMLRAVNARKSMLVQASAQLYLLLEERSPEGHRLRRLLDLRLLREIHPMFFLSWTLIHVIDANSPLFGMRAEQLADRGASLILTISGSDEITTQELRSRHLYSSDAIRWDHVFEDLLQIDAEGREHIDYEHVHSTRPQRPSDAATVHPQPSGDQME